MTQPDSRPIVPRGSPSGSQDWPLVDGMGTGIGLRPLARARGPGSLAASPVRCAPAAIHEAAVTKPRILTARPKSARLVIVPALGCCATISAREPSMAPDLLYRRVLLKISGEALMAGQDFGIDPDTLERIGADVSAVQHAGVQVCLVVGGGNIFRGLRGVAAGIERASGDNMGMLATVINALALQSVLERQGVATRVQSAIPMAAVCEPFVRRRALRHLEKGRVVIFAAGTGNPYFTTDTAAALRASEMGCEALLKGTKVDGVYSADPEVDKNAERFETLTYKDVLARDLGVMDAAAIALARENKIPILVFSIREPGVFLDVLKGGARTTTISDGA